MGAGNRTVFTESEIKNSLFFFTEVLLSGNQNINDRLILLIVSVHYHLHSC